MDSETESNNATMNDCSIGSLSTLEADDQHHLMIVGKLGKRGVIGMSHSRKLCFIISIVLLLGFVMIFLFVLPCPDEDSCSNPFGRSGLHWIKDYDKFEMKGPVNVIKNSGKDGGTNLIFMYKGDKFIEAMNRPNSKSNGLISIVSKTGEISWQAKMHVEPRYVNCSIIDVDRDGQSDCLVVDTFGQLSALKSSNGKWIWETKEANSGRIPEIYEDLFNFPLLLPDLDDDSVNELLHVFSSSTNTQNSFSLLSGRSGKLIGHSIPVTECIFIYQLQLVEWYTVRYTCINTTSSYTKSIGLNDLYLALTGSSINFTRLNSSNSLPQYKYTHGFRSQSNTTLRNFNLVIENVGTCPDNCNSSITLIDTAQTGHERATYNFSGRNMYTHYPEKLHFTNSHKHNFGFVFKYLQWSNNEINAEAVSMLQKIQNSAQEKYNKTDVIKVRLIKETVVLIVFSNSDDIKIENTSQSHIMQFCRLDKNGGYICQPRINSLDNSLLIADLDEDGSLELVSFYSTFSVFNNQDHVLKTYVQLLNLEQELPKLYGPDRRRRK